jgi:hypothetical protein
VHLLARADVVRQGDAPQRAPSSGMPMSSASFSRAQSTRMQPLASKNAVSSTSIAADQPNAS